MEESIEQVHAEGVALLDAGDVQGAKVKFQKVHHFETQSQGSEKYQGFSGTYCLAQCEEKLGYADAANHLYLQCGLHIPEARTKLCGSMQLTSFLDFRFSYGSIAGAYYYALSIYTSAPEKALRYFNMVVSEENEHQGAAYFAIGCIYLKAPSPKKIRKGIDYILCANSMDYDSASMFLLQLSTWSKLQIDVVSGNSFTHPPYECALTMYHDDEGENAIAFLKNNVLKVNAPLAHYTMGLMSLSLEKYSKGFTLMLKAAVAKYEKTDAFFGKIQRMIA